jgi:hypothetical protein
VGCDSPFHSLADDQTSHLSFPFGYLNYIADLADVHSP